jgi:hypothetical protein
MTPKRTLTSTDSPFTLTTKQVSERFAVWGRAAKYLRNIQRGNKT